MKIISAIEFTDTLKFNGQLLDIYGEFDVEWDDDIPMIYFQNVYNTEDDTEVEITDELQTLLEQRMLDVEGARIYEDRYAGLEDYWADDR